MSLPARLGLLVLGVFACATSVIFIRLSESDPALLASARLLVALPLLWPFFARARSVGGAEAFLRRRWRSTVWPGALLGIHFVSWLVGARLTPAANSSLIVNLVVVVMPYLMWLEARERLRPAEWLGTALAVAGVVVLAGGDFNLNPDYFLGDVVCFGSMLFYAVYLAQGRKNRDFPGLWLYLWPVYAWAALFALLGGVCCWVLGWLPPPQIHVSWGELGCLLGLALVPTILGHSLMNFSMKHLRGQLVAVINLGQFVFAGGMAFLFLGEVPALNLYAASLLLVVGAAVCLLGSRR